MLKKVLKYIGLAVGLLTGLPLLVAPLVYTLKIANASTSETVGLFEDLEDMEALVKDFNPFWIVALRVLVIMALAVAVITLVVAILDDLKVLKLQNVEKVLAVSLLVIGLLAVITLLVNQFTNSNFETTEVFGSKVTNGSSIVANVMGWLFPIFALASAGLVFATVDSKKKSKKRK